MPGMMDGFPPAVVEAPAVIGTRRRALEFEPDRASDVQVAGTLQPPAAWVIHCWMSIRS